MSPLGSSPLYQNLVPRQFQEQSDQERISELEQHLVSHGLNQETVGMCLDAGVRTLQLLALLQPRDVVRLFPRMPGQQRRLLEISIRRLDPRPSYQITAGLKRFLTNPAQTDTKKYSEEVNEKIEIKQFRDEGSVAAETKAALQLVESSKKILECPVCYLTCLPPRIWQVSRWQE